VIPCGAYDRTLDFFAELSAAHLRSAHVQLNYGYAYVDKIPAAGATTRVILASKASSASPRQSRSSPAGSLSAADRHLPRPRPETRSTAAPSLPATGSQGPRQRTLLGSLS
jgi:hypothetical protein